MLPCILRHFWTASYMLPCILRHFWTAIYMLPCILRHFWTASYMLPCILYVWAAQCMHSRHLGCTCVIFSLSGLHNVCIFMSFPSQCIHFYVMLATGEHVGKERLQSLCCLSVGQAILFHFQSRYARGFVPTAYARGFVPTAGRHRLYMPKGLSQQLIMPQGLSQRLRPPAYRTHALTK